MAVVTMKELLESGAHFGHQVKRWNPKMKKYIFGERNGIHIVDLQKTLKGVEEAYNFLRSLAVSGGDVLFVGTKKQAQDAVTEEAKLDIVGHTVTEQERPVVRRRHALQCGLAVEALRSGRSRCG